MTGAADLLREATQVNYRLRSTFFLRKLREYNAPSLPARIEELLPFEGDYDWTHRSLWGVGEEAFSFIAGSQLAVLQVFCHPKVLRDYPNMVAYYRNIAVLSQKAVQRLVAVNVKPFEAPNWTDKTLSTEGAQRLATLFNQHLTLIVDSSLRTFSLAELNGLLFASTGAQIDGSWRNAIGDEAEKVVQRLLVKEALDRSLLKALLPRTAGPPVSVDSADIDNHLTNVKDYRGFTLANQTSVLFSSEPDVSLVRADGTNVGVIEVKGGVDPAGALERYGAAKKSFAEDPAATTILVASCITAEVHTRIQNDPAISHYYNLTEILSENGTLRAFLDVVYALLLGA